MSSATLLLLLCGSILVSAGVAGTVYLFVTSRKPKKETVMGPPRPAQQGLKSWIIPITIAGVIAVWNVSLAIVYLLIVRVLRSNPKKELSHIVTDEERKVCEKNYKWLMNSSFFTVPVFLIALFMDVHPAIAAFIPFVFHLPLIDRLQTENLFVFRHTQQTLILLLLRAGTAIAIFSLIYIEGFWFFVIINGTLWLVGTNWETAQVKRNDCWLMRRRGEEILSKEVVPGEESSISKDELNEMLKSLNAKGSTARQQALSAFRVGTPEERKKAVLILTELGDVEKF